MLNKKWESEILDDSTPPERAALKMCSSDFGAFFKRRYVAEEPRAYVDCVVLFGVSNIYELKRVGTRKDRNIWFSEIIPESGKLGLTWNEVIDVFKAARLIDTVAKWAPIPAS